MSVDEEEDLDRESDGEGEDEAESDGEDEDEDDGDWDVVVPPEWLSLLRSSSCAAERWRSRSNGGVGRLLDLRHSVNHAGSLLKSRSDRRAPGCTGGEDDRDGEDEDEEEKGIEIAADMGGVLVVVGLPWIVTRWRFAVGGCTVWSVIVDDATRRRFFLYHEQMTWLEFMAKGSFDS
jgi:hypothetical protein